MLVQSVISALKKAIGAFSVHPLPHKVLNTAQDLMENVPLQGPRYLSTAILRQYRVVPGALDHMYV